MALMHKLSLSVLVILVFGILTFLQAALILDKCTRHSQCPADSRCRPSGCDGYTCRCDVNFVYSDDRKRCIPGKLVGEACDGNLNKCLSPFALCRDGVCRCNMLMEPTTDGLCRAPFEAEIHQSCEEKFCVSSTVCVNDVCECPDEMREITLDEYWFDPFKVRRCVNSNHSLEYCNGIKLPLLSDLQTEDTDVIPGKSTGDVVTQTPNDVLQNEAKPEVVITDVNTQQGKENFEDEGNGASTNPLDMLEMGQITRNIQTSEFHDKGTKAMKIQSIRSKDDPGDKSTVAMFSLIGVADPSKMPEDGNDGDLNSGRSAQIEKTMNLVSNSEKKIEDYTDDVADGLQVQNHGNTEVIANPAQSTINVNDENAGYENMNTVVMVNQGVENKPPLGLGLLSEEIKDDEVAESRNTVETSILSENQESSVTDIRNLNDTLLSSVAPGPLQLLLKSFLGDMLQNNKKINVYQGCSSDLQCPTHAYCTIRGCNQRKQCLCREGYMSSRNGSSCVPDASRACLVSEFRCDSSHRCIPLSWVCDGVKDCPSNEDEGPQCVHQSHHADNLKDRNRLEDKLNHEASMRMHLEKNIQRLQEEITQLKADYSDRRIPSLPSSLKPNEHSSTEAGEQNIWPNSDSDIFYEGYTETIQTLMKKYGMYTLWGGKMCPRDENTKTLYSGIMSSGFSPNNNRDGDILCLPEIPEYDQSGTGSLKNILDDRLKISGFSRHFTCALCQVRMISSVQMIPAKTACPKDWKLEYAGILVAAGGVQSLNVCMEKSAMINGGLEDSRGQGPYLTPVTVECGRIPCPPYKQNDYLPCVVCSI